MDMNNIHVMYEQLNKFCLFDSYLIRYWKNMKLCAYAMFMYLIRNRTLDMILQRNLRLYEFISDALDKCIYIYSLEKLMYRKTSSIIRIKYQTLNASRLGHLGAAYIRSLTVYNTIRSLPQLLQNETEGVADLQATDHELQLNFSILPFVGRNGSSKLG